MNTLEAPALTDQQILQFKRDSFLILPGLFSPEETEQIKDTFMAQAQNGPVEDRFRRSLIFHYVPRFSQELSEWYKLPTTFDGEVVEIAAATGGGPCGTTQPSVNGPH